MFQNPFLSPPSNCSSAISPFESLGYFGSRTRVLEEVDAQSSSLRSFLNVLHPFISHVRNPETTEPIVLITRCSRDSLMTHDIIMTLQSFMKDSKSNFSCKLVDAGAHGAFWFRKLIAGMRTINVIEWGFLVWWLYAVLSRKLLF